MDKLILTLDRQTSCMTVIYSMFRLDNRACLSIHNVNGKLIFFSGLCALQRHDDNKAISYDNVKIAITQRNQ